MEIARRRTFSPEEDEILKEFVKEYGNRNWRKASLILHGRTPRQCRDRYRNYLKEGLNSHSWSEDEDSLIKKMYNDIGPKWVTISKMLKDRNGIDVKNRWIALNSNPKTSSKGHNRSHDEKSNKTQKKKSKSIALKETVYDQSENIKKEENNQIEHFTKPEDLNLINFDIAISEEEFDNIASIMDYILPIEEYDIFGTNRIDLMF